MARNQISFQPIWWYCFSYIRVGLGFLCIAIDDIIYLYLSKRLREMWSHSIKEWRCVYISTRKTRHKGSYQSVYVLLGCIYALIRMQVETRRQLSIDALWILTKFIGRTKIFRGSSPYTKKSSMTTTCLRSITSISFTSNLVIDSCS